MVVAAVNEQLESKTAEQRVAWVLEHLPEQAVLSSSFCIQEAVSLQLVTRLRPDIPVILTDMGYLFPETYRFSDELTERWGLTVDLPRQHLPDIAEGELRQAVGTGHRGY